MQTLFDRRVLSRLRWPFCSLPPGLTWQAGTQTQGGNPLNSSCRTLNSRIACRYGPQLERLYAEQEERLKERLRAMRAGGDASVPERVQQALQVCCRAHPALVAYLFSSAA